jgi:hypothetical protein
MAFLNEKLTDEQREEFASKGIMSIYAGGIVKPLYWTIDKEANNYLIRLGKDREMQQYIKLLFIYKNELITVDTEQILKEGNKCGWKVFPVQSTKNSSADSSFYAELKKALFAFKGDGTTQFWNNCSVDSVDFIMRGVE